MIRKHPVWMLSLVVLVGAPIAAYLFPVYFRMDDTTYLKWVTSHPNPLSAFVPSSGVLFEMFRPLHNVVWWFLVNLFGLNTFPYQVLEGFVYGFSFVAFFNAIRIMYDERIAWLSLLSYWLVFHYLAYTAFWFSHLALLHQLLLISLAVGALVRSVKSGRFPVLGLLLYVCAGLFREPSILIIPAVFFTYVVANRREISRPERAMLFSSVLLAVGFALVFVNPFIQTRQAVPISSGVGATLQYLWERWSYYAGFLGNRQGLLLWLGVASVAVASNSNAIQRVVGRKVWWVVAFVGTLALLSVTVHDKAIGLVLLMLLLGVTTLLNLRYLPAAVWFALPLMAILTSALRARTYLSETAFGASLLIGLGFNQILAWCMDLSTVRRYYRALARRWILKVGAAVAILIICIGIGRVVVAPKVRILSALSENRQNMRRLVEYILEQKEEIGSGPLVMLSYKDMDLNYWRDIATLGDREKALRQKSMDLEELRQFLDVIGLASLPLLSYEEFTSPGTSRSEGFIILMGEYERRFLLAKAPWVTEVFGHSGIYDGVWIYRISNMGTLGTTVDVETSSVVQTAQEG